MIDPANLRELLDIDYETGRMVWKPRPSGWSQWNGRYAGKEAFTARRGPYRHGSIDGRLYQAHRVIYAAAHGVWPELVDHINQDPSDNRLCNLRAAGKRLNALNSKIRADNSTGAKGVSWSKVRRAWRAYFTENGKQFHLGYFGTLEQAADARAAATELRMEPR
jgi:hypothetical protein